jgi:hypothetical protein
MLFTFNDGLFERMYHGRAQVITLSLRKPTAQEAAATLLSFIEKATSSPVPSHLCNPEKENQTAGSQRSAETGNDSIS